MKKLLFLGIDSTTSDALAYAKAKGVYTIITDHLEKNSSPLKAEADECWQINVTDLDALERRCRAENVAHIYAGSHELCLDCSKLLCERLGLPYYVSAEGWQAARDKACFKEYCGKVGLDVPRKYWIGGNPPRDAFAEIRFPVVVKPNDCTAKKGFSVVGSLEELWPAIDKALSFSDQKKIIVEDFIAGNLVTATFCNYNGKLTMIDTMIGMHGDNNATSNFCFGVHQSRYNEDIQKRLLPLYEKLIREMNCRQGVCFIQSILRDGIYYHLEIGYRLDGAGSWRHIERLTGYNQLKYMVDLALREATGDSFSGNGATAGTEICACVAYWGRSSRICSIEGKQELVSRPDVIVRWDRFQEGDVIPNTADMTALTLMIEVFGNDYYEIGEKINEINHSLHYCNEKGEELLIFHDSFSEKWDELRRKA